MPSTDRPRFRKSLGGESWEAWVEDPKLSNCGRRHRHRHRHRQLVVVVAAVVVVVLVFKLPCLITSLKHFLECSIVTHSQIYSLFT